jgi:hypothetical protein
MLITRVRSVAHPSASDAGYAPSLATWLLARFPFVLRWVSAARAATTHHRHVTVLVPYSAEEVDELLVTFPLGVPDVLIVRGTILQSVEEYACEVVDRVRSPCCPLAFGHIRYSRPLAITSQS